MPKLATGQVRPDSRAGLPRRVDVTSTHVPGLGFEIVSDQGALFAIAKDQRTAWLIAGAVNTHLQTLNRQGKAT